MDICSKLLILSFAGFLGAHFNGIYYRNKIDTFKLDAERQYSALLLKKIETDKQNQAKITEIEANSVKQLDEQKRKYEKTISNLRNNFKPSGVLKCPSSGNSVSRTNNNPSEVICYTRDELQRRIEQTLAIGHECDQLALKYNSLLKICGGSKE